MKKLLCVWLLLCFSVTWAVAAESDILTLDMLEELALSGDAEAGFILGGKYHMGAGVPQNYAKAFKWYGLAAEQGYALAQFMLGNMYAAGSGVTADNDKAVEWYRKAAEQGHAGAQLALAVAYMSDMTGDMGMARIYMWLELASQSGNADEAEAAASLLSLLSILMTDEEIAFGREMTADWRRKGAGSGGVLTD